MNLTPMSFSNNSKPAFKAKMDVSSIDKSSISFNHWNRVKDEFEANTRGINDDLTLRVSDRALTTNLYVDFIKNDKSDLSMHIGGSAYIDLKYLDEKDLAKNFEKIMDAGVNKKIDKGYSLIKEEIGDDKKLQRQLDFVTQEAKTNLANEAIKDDPILNKAYFYHHVKYPFA